MWSYSSLLFSRRIKRDSPPILWDFIDYFFLETCVFNIRNGYCSSADSLLNVSFGIISTFTGSFHPLETIVLDTDELYEILVRPLFTWIVFDVQNGSFLENVLLFSWIDLVAGFFWGLLKLLAMRFVNLTILVHDTDVSRDVWNSSSYSLRNTLGFQFFFVLFWKDISETDASYKMEFDAVPVWLEIWQVF